MPDNRDDLGSLRSKLVLAHTAIDVPKGSELRFLLVLAVTYTKLKNILLRRSK